MARLERRLVVVLRRLQVLVEEQVPVLVECWLLTQVGCPVRMRVDDRKLMPVGSLQRM